MKSAGKRDQLSEFFGKFRYLGMEALSQEFLIENCSVNVEFLESKTEEEVSAGPYLQFYLLNGKSCSAN